MRSIKEMDKRLDEREQEIERLNNKVEELMTLYTTERNVKDDYKAIIKEVREWILKQQLGKRIEPIISTDELDEVLEILDKENMKKDKKIEKLDLKYDDIIYSKVFKEQILMYCNNLQIKINEIIDYLEENK